MESIFGTDITAKHLGWIALDPAHSSLPLDRIGLQRVQLLHRSVDERCAGFGSKPLRHKKERAPHLSCNSPHSGSSSSLYSSQRRSLC